ncbi:MAG: acyl-CoA dehydrogenase family protein, partial [Bacteroidota bacterium]
MTSSPNTGTAPNAADYPADVLAVLPLLYVAWADGVITPSEHTALRKRLQSFDWMDPEHRDAVQQWLDPEHPPTPTEYQRWRRRLQKAATDLPVTGRTSLAALGAEMASLGGDGAPGMPNEAQHALREVEAALGIAGDEIVDELRGERPAPSEEVPSGIPCQVERLKAYLDGEHAELRDQIRTLLTDPVFRYDSSLGTEAKRERVLYWCRLLADQGLGALAFPKEYGGTGSIDKFITAFETLSYHDLSLVIKFGVQFGLFGGSVHQLGSARHHEKYLEDIGTLELPGCFAMSELGHGSNVRDLETTA